jgi:hypothetical protein
LLEFMDSLEWNGLFSLWTINSIIYTVSIDDSHRKWPFPHRCFE